MQHKKIIMLHCLSRFAMDVQKLALISKTSNKICLTSISTVYAFDSRGPFPIHLEDENSSPPTKPEHWLYEGDIMLSEGQNEMIEFPKKKGEEKPSSDRAYTAARQEKKLWFGGVIPYVIDCSLKNMPALVDIVKKAMKEWESKTCITFVERDQEEDYVLIMRGTHCFSTVGRAKGRKLLSVGYGCEFHNVMLHELGHVIGYWHEQSRPDRDEHIRILWKNIARGWENSFFKLNWKAADTMRMPYDYSSIMHYPFNAFSKKSNKRTIVPLRPVKARPYKTLSQLDIHKTNLLYSCSNSPEDNEVAVDHQESSVAALRRKKRAVVQDVDITTTTTTTTYSNQNSCKNKVGDEACKYWADRGFCTKRKDFMLIDCMKSCNACSTEQFYRGTQVPRVTLISQVSPQIQHGKSIHLAYERREKRIEAKRKAKRRLKLLQQKRRKNCKDKLRSCGHWAKKGFCPMREEFMRKHCIKSCKMCYPETGDCVDRDTRCKKWARLRYCANRIYKNVMESFCPNSCGLCGDPAKMCFDKEKHKCSKWKENGFCESEDKDIKEAMKMLCTKTCRQCDKHFKLLKNYKCTDNFKTCHRWHKLGYCETRPLFMNQYCRKSCQICRTKVDTTACLDNAVGCEQRKADGLCEKDRKSMKFHCRKTCGFCHNPEQSIQGQAAQREPCKDLNKVCPTWAELDYCHTKALYMVKYCKESCGICDGNGSNLYKPYRYIPRPRRRRCINRWRSCTYWADIGMCHLRPDLMLRDCKLACRVCRPAKKQEAYPPCKNIADDDNCEHWASLGKCSSRPDFMISQCSKTCNSCPTRPVKTVPAKPVGILCKYSCKMWLDNGYCNKWKGRCSKACLAKGCDVEAVKPLGSCAEPMGAGWDYKLPDSAFTASSTLITDKWDFGAHNARLYKEDDLVYKKVGGWCAKEPNDQWLQVDLGRPRIITSVATQGRDKFFEHVKSYQLGFSDDGKTFYKYMEKGKVKILPGNCDHFTPVINQLRRPHLARYVRFYPITKQSVCMRVEIYGCKELTDEAKHDYPHVVHLRHYRS